MNVPFHAEVIRLSPHVRCRAVGDEGVLVHLENARVLVVNSVGLHVVQQLEKRPMTMGELIDSVLAEFEVEADQARADVEVFLGQLRDEQALDSPEPGHD